MGEQACCHCCSPRLMPFHLKFFRSCLQAARDAAKAAPAVPAQPPAAPTTLTQADLQALVQQALAAANGQATPPPQAPPSTGTAQPMPPPEGWCALHQVQMELRNNERGSWWSHRLADGSYCKGK